MKSKWLWWLGAAMVLASGIVGYKMELSPALVGMILAQGIGLMVIAYGPPQDK